MDKNPTDEIMRDAIYTALMNTNPDQIRNIEYANDDGWNKYWREVLQSTVITLT